jgi:hypothetical protein
MCENVIQIRENISNSQSKFYTDVIVNDEKNYIANGYVQIPMYDVFDVLIGYECNTNVIQKQDDDKYILRLNTTFNFEKTGTINVLFNTNISTPNIIFEEGTPIVGTIISGSGSYTGKTGVVSIIPFNDGRREITIAFNVI